MPMIVAGPGIRPGQVRADLVSGIDIAPASLAAAGMEIPDHMEGADFLAKNYQPENTLPPPAIGATTPSNASAPWSLRAINTCATTSPTAPSCSPATRILAGFRFRK